MLAPNQNPSPVTGEGTATAAALWSPKPRHCGPVPRSVAIVAMGKSFGTYVYTCARKGDRRLVADETWAVVAMAGVVQHDRLYLMDDIPNILQPTLEHDVCMRGMWGWLKDHPGPVYTSKAYPEFPGTVEYPLAEVVAAVGMPYFSTSVAYAVGDAIRLGEVGLEEIQLYGCDFTYPDKHIAEAGRACVEFLLAIAIQRGIKITIAEDSTLLDVSEPKRKLYGYFSPPKITMRDRDAEAATAPAETKDELPSAPPPPPPPPEQRPAAASDGAKPATTPAKPRQRRKPSKAKLQLAALHAEGVTLLQDGIKTVDPAAWKPRCLEWEERVLAAAAKASKPLRATLRPLNVIEPNETEKVAVDDGAHQLDVWATSKVVRLVGEYLSKH